MDEQERRALVEALAALYEALGCIRSTDMSGNDEAACETEQAIIGRSFDVLVAKLPRVRKDACCDTCGAKRIPHQQDWDNRCPKSFRHHNPCEGRLK